MEELFRPQVVERRRQRLFGEVVVTSPRAASIAVVLMMTIALMIVVWACIARYPRTERVEGVVVTDRPLARVHALRAGVIDRLFVANGDWVEAGAPLAYVAVGLRDAGRRSAAEDSLEAIGRQAESLEAQLASIRDSRRQENARLDEIIAANLQDIVSLERQIEQQERVLALGTDVQARLGVLAEKGYFSTIELKRREQALLVERQRLEQLRQQSNQAHRKAGQFRAEKRLLDASHANRTAQVNGQRDALSDTAARTRVEVGYTLVAPITGKVTALQAGIGRTVDGQKPLMAIMPPNTSHRAELFIPSRAAGFIAPGQRVKLMYDAFPYRRFGSFDGRIVRVSETTVTPPELDFPLATNEPVYRAEVALSGQSVAVSGGQRRLTSGMHLTASLVLEERTFFTWLLSPITAVRNRA